ncbi:MAG: hypothetical protein H7Y04_10710 [Verrucomicrobia bacterium]|nr:hypothetical protein [Cytophagales bacterium]
MQNLMDEKFVKIDYDATQKIVAAKWNGFLKLEDLQKGCKEINSQIKKEKLTKHLSDQTQLKVLVKEVQEYIGAVWFDEVEKLGLRKIAILVAEDIFAQAAVNKVNLNAQYKKLEINSFSSLDQCHTWLNEKPID